MEKMVKIAKPLTPLKAIRRMCLVCCSNQYKLIRECNQSRECPLFEFRFGRLKSRAGIGGKPTHGKNVVPGQGLLTQVSDGPSRSVKAMPNTLMVENGEILVKNGFVTKNDKEIVIRLRLGSAEAKLS